MAAPSTGEYQRCGNNDAKVFFSLNQVVKVIVCAIERATLNSRKKKLRKKKTVLIGKSIKMKSVKLTTVACFVLCELFTNINLIQATNLPNDKSQALSKAHFEFSLDLYKTLLKPNQNLMMSPYSINLVLSMLFLGTSSNSNSSRQLRSIMHLKNFDYFTYVDVHNGFKSVVQHFDQNYYNTKMKLAHGFYINSDVTVSPVYHTALKQFYHSSIEHMDFRYADSQLTKDVINNFISESTDGLIDDMLEEVPKDDSKLIAVDAMTLSTKWLYPFDEKDTFEKGLFYLPNEER